MKRLFALCGFTYLFVQIATFYVFKELGWVIAVIAVLAGVLTLIFAKSKYFKSTVCVACITAVLAGSVFCLYSDLYYTPKVQEYSNQQVLVKAQLTEEPHKAYGVYYYQLNSQKIDNKDAKCKMLLKSVYQIDMEVFDYITFTETLEKCDNNGYLSKGVLYLVNAGYDFDYGVTKCTDKPLYSLAIEARKAMKHAIDVLMPAEIADLSKAIAIGDRFSVEEDLKSDFRKTGVSHFIVVSGLHLVIVSEFVRRILSVISRRNRYVEGVGTILAILAFMAVTGFGASALRAGIMMIIFLVARMIFVKSDSINSLGIAVLVMCVPNPFAVGDIGLLLSIFATLGILMFARKIEYFICPKINLKFKYVNKAVIYIIKTMSVTASAFVFILPITLLAFNSFSIMVYLATLVISPFVSILIICVLVSSILFYCGVLSVFAYPFAFVASVIAKIIISVVEFLSNFKFALIYIESIYVVLFLSACAVLIGIALLFRDYKNKLNYSAVMIVIVLLVGFCVNMLPKADVLQIISAEKGTTVMINSPKGNAVLSCGGSASKTMEVLENIAVKGKDISYLTVADNSKISSRYASDILREFDCSAVLLYDNDKTNEEVYRNAKSAEVLMTFTENETAQTQLWDKGTVNLVNIEGNTWQFVNYNGYRVLIIPQKANCIDIPDEYKTAEIIISPICPENYHLLKCHTFVYTGSKEDVSKYTSCFAQISQEIATTINQNITFTLE